MKNFKRIMLILSPCAALSSFDAQAVSNMHAKRADYDMLLAEGKNGVVMITMEGCGHCVHSAPDFENVSRELKDSHIDFLKINKDEEGMREIVDINNIGGFPAYIVVKEGKVQDPENPKMGGKNENQLKSMIDQYIGDVSTSQHVDAMSPVQEAPAHEEGIFDKLKGLFIGLFETIKNIFVSIFDWIKGLFNR